MSTQGNVSILYWNGLTSLYQYIYLLNYEKRSYRNVASVIIFKAIICPYIG